MPTSENDCLQPSMQSRATLPLVLHMLYTYRIYLDSWSVCAQHLYEKVFLLMLFFISVRLEIISSTTRSLSLALSLFLLSKRKKMLIWIYMSPSINTNTKGKEWREWERERNAPAFWDFKSFNCLMVRFFVRPYCMCWESLAHTLSVLLCSDNTVLLYSSCCCCRTFYAFLFSDKQKHTQNILSTLISPKMNENTRKRAQCTRKKKKKKEKTHIINNNRASITNK